MKLKGPFVRLNHYSISDDDFEYDAKLTIDGDWPSVEHQTAYLNAVLIALNTASQPAAPQVSENFAFRVWNALPAWEAPTIEQVRAALEAALAQPGEGE